MNNVVRLSLSAALLTLALTGCPSSGEVQPEESNEVRPDGSGEDIDESRRTLEGMLEYRELPRTRSVEAYMGVEFVLTDAGGVEHVLKASDSVDRDSLITQDGKTVVVVGEWTEARRPDPLESAPTDRSGEPLRRPDYYSVQSLRTAD